MKGRYVSLGAVVLLLGFAGIAPACSPSDDDVTPGDGGDRDNGPDLLPCSSLYDTDGDTIADQYEGTADNDADTVPNNLDDDSDGDGMLDRDEADNMGDFCRFPRNSDTDAAPDFLDTDSDNDGLLDRDERERWSTDPRIADSDGDTVTDLGETAYGSDPLNPDDTIDPDDFFVVLPYNDPETNRELIFGTDIKVADVYFLMDSTGSMSSAITNVVGSLQRDIVPALRAAIPDVQMGVGAFNDYPSGSYGDGMDMPYWHDLNITDDDTAVQNALQYVLDRGRGSGFDTPESYSVALSIAASGRGIDIGGAYIPDQNCPPILDEPVARTGYPCFRPGALPIIVIVGDAPWHNGPSGEYPYDFGGLGYGDAISDMLSIGARVVGVFVTNFDTEGLPHMQQAAIDTGTVDLSGNPLVSESSDGSVSAGIVDQIETLAAFTPQDINTTTEDDPDDLYGVDARQFILAITPVRTIPDGGAASQDDTTFYQVQPGTQVVFNVVFRNTIFAPRDSAAVFKARIVVLGNHVARLDERVVIIVVPPDGDWVPII